MTIVQIENADAFPDLLPKEPTSERLEQLISRLKQLIGMREIWLAIIEDTNKALKTLEAKLSEEQFQVSSYRKNLVDRRTAAALRVTELTTELVEVAVLLAAEARNAELLTT